MSSAAARSRARTARPKIGRAKRACRAPSALSEPPATRRMSSASLVSWLEGMWGDPFILRLLRFLGPDDADPREGLHRRAPSGLRAPDQARPGSIAAASDSKLVR